MQAILSDIHGNLEATEAVLADLRSQNATEIICLGDVIGYGPDSFARLDLALRWSLVLMGNFEQAVLSSMDLPGWTAKYAKESVIQFRRELERRDHDGELLSFLRDRPDHFWCSDALYVHGSPRNRIHEYVFPEDVYNQRKMESIAQEFDQLCFCGHTHVPGIFQQSNSGTWDFMTPEECNYEYPIASARAICNVGSVGQPRDGDPRACYVLLDHRTITFRRVDYDIERTSQKLRDDDGGDFQGARLREGR